MTEITLLRPFGSEIRISSPFGLRKIDGKEEFHNGYDFAVPVGTVVKAAADGAVFRAGWQDEMNHGIGYGYRVWQEIELVEGNVKKRFYIWYGHLSKILVKEGAHIKAGDEIALSGNSGRSFGPHCHVGCREKDTSHFLEIRWQDL